MSYEFKTLGSVEALNEVPTGANALVEVDGAIKRVPGDALGGNKEGNGEAWDFMIRASNPDYYNSGTTFTWAKGDSASLNNALLTGKCPRVCVFYTNESLDMPIALCDTCFGIRLSYGSGTMTELRTYSDQFYYFGDSNTISIVIPE